MPEFDWCLPDTAERRDRVRIIGLGAVTVVVGGGGGVLGTVVWLTGCWADSAIGTESGATGWATVAEE